MSPNNSEDIDFSKTPKFDEPPVIETVMAIQFALLSNLRITHFGGFFDILKDAGFTTVQELPASPHQIEQEVETPQLPIFLSLLSQFQPQSFLPRTWFLSDETDKGQQLVQLQADRIVQNWRRKSLQGTFYPSYSSNRAEFEQTYTKFLSFAEQEKLGKVIPDQCEVSYVNHIPIGDFDGPEEAFRNCFRGLQTFESCPHIPKKASALGLNWCYWLPELNGRLYIQASTAVIPGTHEKVIDLRITARGAPQDISIVGIMKWLNTGHYFVVNCFADITTDEMQQKWKRRD